MPKLLLTGAGFSHNWGVWLASEAFEFLLSCAEIDDPIRQQLWRDKNRGLGYEETPGRLQIEALRDSTGTTQKQVDALTSALGGMFNQMETGLSPPRSVTIQ
jgi:hypothetical protein